MPPPSPGDAASFPLPFVKSPSRDYGQRSACAIQICHTWGAWGTWGKVGYHPRESILCPTCGGAQSEPGGWSNLKSHPGTPISVTGSATYIQRLYNNPMSKVGKITGSQMVQNWKEPKIDQGWKN